MSLSSGGGGGGLLEEGCSIEYYVMSPLYRS